MKRAFEFFFHDMMGAKRPPTWADYAVLMLVIAAIAIGWFGVYGIANGEPIPQ